MNPPFENENLPPIYRTVDKIASPTVKAIASQLYSAYVAEKLYFVGRSMQASMRDYAPAQICKNGQICFVKLN